MQNKTNKIVFWGTPKTAAHCLQHLIECGENVVGVVTQPDKPVGRKHVITKPPVKVIAESFGVPIVQPANLQTPDIVATIANWRPDVCVLVAYGRIITSELLSIPDTFINLHFSLLPAYRGAAPVQRAIIDGRVETGVTVQHLAEKLDHGDVILQKPVQIDKCDTAESLLEECVKTGAPLLSESLRLIRSGAAPRIVQNDEAASYAKKLRKEDGYIDWKRSAREIHNRIRGCYPWPGATARMGDTLLKIWRAEVVDDDTSTHDPGEIILAKKHLHVSTGHGTLALLEVQPTGRARMSAQAFLAGHRSQLSRFALVIRETPGLSA